ncbi:MAG: hypothetical protein M1524_01785 [Patescibacteria group bacterium]|nr:hypothetical protein [Patescibacteria group bacterium]
MPGVKEFLRSIVKPAKKPEMVSGAKKLVSAGEKNDGEIHEFEMSLAGSSYVRDRFPTQNGPIDWMGSHIDGNIGIKDGKVLFSKDEMIERLVKVGAKGRLIYLGETFLLKEGEFFTRAGDRKLNE